MLFTASNRDDIHKYYVNTFVKFRETGETLFHIRGVDSLKVTGKSETGDILELYLDDDHPYEVDYVLPHKSYFQFGAQACQLYRIPARQYQRGINEGNTQIGCIREDGLRGECPLNFEALKVFVNKPKFFFLDEAIASENESCALSPRMMYHKKQRSIYIDFVPVAVVDPVGRAIKMLKPIFAEEVKELVAQNTSIYKDEYKMVRTIEKVANEAY